MSNKRTSVIWKLSKKEFAKIVADSATVTEIIKKCGLRPIGNNNKTIKKRIEEDNVDISHIPLGLNANKGRKFGGVTAIPLKDVLLENSTYNRGHLKRRLIEDGILKEKCAICYQNPEWLSKKLVFILDHINGINNDNRIENLRLLCPNCNSQTETFAGKKNRKPERNVCECGKRKHRKSSKCMYCTKQAKSGIV